MRPGSDSALILSFGHRDPDLTYNVQTSEKKRLQFPKQELYSILVKGFTSSLHEHKAKIKWFHTVAFSIFWDLGLGIPQPLRPHRLARHPSIPEFFIKPLHSSNSSSFSRSPRC